MRDTLNSRSPFAVLAVTVALLLGACSSGSPEPVDVPQTGLEAVATGNAESAGAGDDAVVAAGTYRVTSPTIRLAGGVELICGYVPNQGLMNVTFYSTEQSESFGASLVDLRIVTSYDGTRGEVATEGMIFSVFVDGPSSTPSSVNPVITGGSVTGQGADATVEVTGTFDAEATFEFSGTCTPNIFDS